MATTTTSGTPGSFHENSYPATTIVPEALILSQATYGARVEGDAGTLTIPYVSTPPAAQVVKEAAEIPDGNAQTAEITVTTQKVASLQVLSNEVKYRTELQDMIVEGLRRSVTDRADAVFLQNTAPEAGHPATHPTGLFNYPGIIQGDTITNTLDPLIDAIGKIATNNGIPSALIMNAATWAQLLQLKYADGRPVIDPSAANSPAPVLYGVPVTLNGQAPTGKILINSIREVVAAYGPVNAANSQDRYFENDSFAIRSTLRLGWGVIHPNRLAVITVNTKAK